MSRSAFAADFGRMLKSAGDYARAPIKILACGCETGMGAVARCDERERLSAEIDASREAWRRARPRKLGGMFRDPRIIAANSAFQRHMNQPAVSTRAQVIS